MDPRTWGCAVITVEQSGTGFAVPHPWVVPVPVRLLGTLLLLALAMSPSLRNVLMVTSPSEDAVRAQLDNAETCHNANSPSLM